MNFHLLWITENYFPSKGGMAESCDRIVYHLRQRGVTVDVLYFSQRATRIQHEIVQGGKTLTFPIEEEMAHSFNLAWNFLENYEEKTRFTHLVAFGGFAPLVCSPIYAAWLDLPLITLIRGNDFDAGIFYPRRRAILQDALQSSACVCSVSKDKIWKINRLYPQVNTAYTPNGIDLDNWHLLASDRQRAHEWRNENVEPGRRVIGLFGQLKAKKGVQFFLRALGISAWAPQAHLLFIGDLNEEIEDFLKDYQEHFSYSQYEFMDRFSLLPYYAVCDVIAIPSYYDGLPNVLMEAGALGIPFIASKVAGMADVLEDQKHGFLFQPGDTKDCARAIHEFFQANELVLKDMGNQCYLTIKTQLSHTQECDRYLEVFENYAKK
ncbi:MAG: glycosyltransferase family 4 protein [Microscillaceae bacterium]|nr:glycosyltransferase family 4 protein [Microscillaceae bacterium]